MGLIKSIINHFEGRSPRIVKDMVVLSVNTNNNCDHVLVIYPLSDECTVRVSVFNCDAINDPDFDSVDLFETIDLSRIDALLNLLES